MQELGIYEQLITQVISDELSRKQGAYFVGERQLTSDQAARWLSRFVAHVVELVIDSIPAKGEGKEVRESGRLHAQITLANDILCFLQSKIQEVDFLEDNLIECQGKILTALYDLQNPVATDLKSYIEKIYPLTGLTQSELFCGANAGLSLESELKREILSADEICWLVSFIKWAGIRIFRRELEEFTASGRKLKIITTSYMGATDAKAIRYLADLPNTEIKLSYNTDRERLHAKSYLFLRNTGFHTGYIGSSNLSHSALTNGLEWNLKITSQEIPHIIEKSKSTFDTYWASREFERYENTDTSYEKLVRALRNERSVVSGSEQYFFDLQPLPHQREILERLTVEREVHDRHRNLVVAATGTGKTLISAFDFARFRQSHPQAKLLFVAHREEILKQARTAYRGVLRDADFGELWVGSQKPAHYRALFVSVQTLNNQLADLHLTPDYYDYIVIDEVHHIAASSYREVINYFKSKILLGLTATPERHDGSDILSDFCDVIAAEIRLPEAINRRHLCPFQYFAVDDDTDLRKVGWSRGRYDVTQLNDLYIHNQTRFERILQSMQEIITDLTRMKALAFCVSRDHANWMQEQFERAGLKADVLTSDNAQDRVEKVQAVRSGAIQILCVVDIFNEGVDIPEIDTLLFLRPTESLTIFLQQFGRGLRLSPGKECCTVLDFVGNCRPEYDFAGKFRALVGRTNQAISREIKEGFPHAPLGCRIELSKRTQEIVLKNIEKATLNQKRLIEMIRAYPQHSSDPLSLTNFLKIHPQVNLDALYKVGAWTGLVEKAKNVPIHQAVDEKVLKRLRDGVFRRLLVCDDYGYLQFVKEQCKSDFQQLKNDDRQSLMCYYDFCSQPGHEAGYLTLTEAFKSFNHPEIKAELIDVLNWKLSSTEHLLQAMPDLNSVPLKLHARYTRDQILTAFGAMTFETRPSAREGVFVLSNENIELLFVTLDKSEKEFSPTTMYHDYAINEMLFHWQSQNSARPDRGKGKSYIEHKTLGKRIFLFVREQKEDALGRTMGFVNFGEVDYVSHTGAQPMNITWQLHHPMPDFMWKAAAKLAIG